MGSLFASGFTTGFGSAFLQFSLERLATFVAFAWKEIALIWNVEDELRKLQRTFLRIQDLVGHVESNQLRLPGGSKAWQIWLEDLRNLAYDADALLDDVSLHLSKYCKKHSVDDCQEKKVFSMILTSFKLDVPHEIKAMQKRLEDLAGEVKSLLDIEYVKRGNQRSWYCPDYSNNSSILVNEQAIVGRQQDKEKVVRLLGENNDTLSVISLVGMGGVGKTTLARLVFNYKEPQTANGFNMKIWVSVSLDFDVRRITKSIAEYATRKTCQVSELDLLQRELQHVLSRVKFLLVLDDYWNESLDDWDLLSAPFRSASRGSKVIVTTRSAIVSKVVGSTKACIVQELSTDDCWRLMKQRAFLQNEENASLETIGKNIAKKCKGLPLAAKVLGSLLCHKSTEYEWRCIENSELWNLPEDKNGIFPSLMLSYLNLPFHLQKCFAYCSIFPPKHIFVVKELVFLWMAEGFIQPQGVRRLEDIGNDYFNGLRMRSFFQEADADSSRKYKMHDLLHDLACVVSTNMCFQVKNDPQNSYPLFGNACHLSLHHHSTQALELKATRKNERLRTFMVLCPGGVHGKGIGESFFPKMKFLRVLFLCDIGLNELPDSINHLTYLRYLNLCRNPIQRLPRSICDLLALQTLLLCNCLHLVELPKRLKELYNLRHLMFDSPRVSSMPPELSKLTNLQTLSKFIVGSRKGHGIEELANMDSLRGTLCIMNIDKVSEVTQASNAKMKMKKYLSTLELVWKVLEDGLDQQVRDQRLEQQENVLEKLEPHENLEELQIKSYCGIKCPKWLCDPCRKFTEISLQGLSYCKALPPLGELQSLKILRIGEMKALGCIGQSFYGNGNGEKFPSLEYLEVHQMAELDSWIVPNGIRFMLCLITLSIDNCPKLRAMPESLWFTPKKTIRNCRYL